MKQFVLFLTVLLFMVKSFSQNAAASKEYFMKKSRTQKTLGWVMIGAGVIITTVGVTIAHKKENDFLNTLSDKGLGIVIAAAGIGTGLSSIFFFTSSAKNARRAMLITFNTQKIRFPAYNTVFSKTQPALTFTIRF
jgi:formate-dependent nitrite reductase membrane component NrfD